MLIQNHVDGHRVEPPSVVRNQADIPPIAVLVELQEAAILYRGRKPVAELGRARVDGYEGVGDSAVWAEPDPGPNVVGEPVAALRDGSVRCPELSDGPLEATTSNMNWK